MKEEELNRRVASWAILIAALASGAAGQVWESGSQLMPASGYQAGAQFGAVVALGDFDGDGDLDLAVSAPFHDLAGGVDHGRVQFLMNQGGRDYFYLNGTLTGGPGERAGTAVAAGDFDGDGVDEIAVGIPRRDGFVCAPGEESCDDSGEVVLFKMESGIWVNKGRHTELSWDDGPETSDRFGEALAVGDFDADGVEDLAVGSPAEDVGSAADAGKVTVFYRPIPNPIAWDELYVGTGNLIGASTGTDGLGRTLAAGDFDGNGVDDLAIGAPGRDLEGITNAGQIHVVHGLEDSGLTRVGQGLISYSSFGRSPSEYDNFGAALAAGNFDETALYCILGGACEDDLAIGVPGDDVVLAPGLELEQAGRVLVSYGSPSGLALDGFTLLTQVGLSDSAEEYDHFGARLAAGRLRCNGIGGCLSTPADLIIGVPEENAGATLDTGYIHAAFGSTSGVAQGEPGEQPLPSSVAFGTWAPVAGDQWGEALAVGDLDRDGYGDLVVGLPHRSYFDLSDAGVVVVLYGAMFADGFETGGVANWSVKVP